MWNSIKITGKPFKQIVGVSTELKLLLDECKFLINVWTHFQYKNLKHENKLGRVKVRSEKIFFL